MRRRRVLAFPWYATATILIVGFGATFLFVRADYQGQQAAAREVATESTAALRAALADELNGYIAATGAGAAFVDTSAALSDEARLPEGQLLADGFPTFAGNLLLHAGPALRDFQLAPAGVVSFSANPEENAMALGHDLLVKDVHRAQILAAVIAREPAFTGPVDLLQGGRGVIAREAIYSTWTPPFGEHYRGVTGTTAPIDLIEQVPKDFWGFATAVIDFDQLIASVHSTDSADHPGGLDPDTMALTSDSAPGTGVIWGNAAAVGPDSAAAVIDLPGSTHWTLWQQVPPLRAWAFILIAVIGIALTIGALVLARATYVSTRRTRIGFDFGERLVADHDRAKMLGFTADFITESYPKVRGRIRLVADAGLTADIGPQSADGPILLSREVWHAGELQCVIEIVDLDGADRGDLEEFLDLIQVLLGANLASAARRVQLEVESSTDTLTQVFNRRHFQEIFDDKRGVAHTLGWRLAVGVIDIDNFKSINDTYGHLFGDAMLAALSQGISHAVRDFDAVFRFGGDEFVVLCLMEHGDHALGMFDRIHEAANAAMCASMPTGIRCTASIGFTLTDEGREERINELLAKADQALYSAKEHGRDQVREWQEPAPA